jgi:titin
MLLLVQLASGRTARASAYTTANFGGDTNDGACEPLTFMPFRNCTLREAINAANADPGLNTIDFGGVFGVSIVIVISPISSLPAVTGPTTIDGTTAGAGRVGLNGASAGAGSNGLQLDATGNVRGFAIYNFSQGIYVNGGGSSVIENNYLGIDASGAAAGNGFGVYIDNSFSNRIGGTSPSQRNIISGNDIGVEINWAGSVGNLVIGNYIGTNLAGTAAVPNGIGVGIGFDASSNYVGGDEVAERNLISGNTQYGVFFTYDATNNFAQGNYIGTDVFGESAVPNTQGVAVYAPGNTVGGAAALNGEPPGNTISGNSVAGILVAPEGAGAIVQGNRIGVNSGNVAAIPNGNGGDASGGIVIEGVGTSVGGTVPTQANVIAGNNPAGIWITESGSDNAVQGNLLGIIPSMTMPNYWGLWIGGSDNVIGGTTDGARNYISGNNTGVSLANNASGNVVQGNYIGTDVKGNSERGNTYAGVQIESGQDNLIGGTEGTTPGGPCTGACNLISGNGANNGAGIRIAGDASSGNQVLGNYIGTNAAGTAAIPNDDFGINVFNAPGNDIGGPEPGAGNVIAATTGAGYGIILFGDGSDSNAVRGNLIGIGADGQTPLGNTVFGVRILSGDANLVGGPNAGDANVIVNNAAGIAAIGPDAVNNSFLRNSIHSNAGLGIQLDPGANNDQQAPILTSAVNGSTTITGTLDSAPNTTYRIEFFANTACDGSGAGEGETFLGSADRTTDGGGHAVIDATFPSTVGAGGIITATATDPGGNTSEFSNCVTVTGPATPTPTPPPTPTPTPTATPGGETPTPTPTGETPTPTPTPTPTATPDGIQGDTNCDETVTAVDALFILREVARLSPGACAENGDVNCDGDRTSVDALGILRHVAGLPVNQGENCPDIGTPV